MWMSLMTSGEKMRLRPRMLRLRTWSPPIGRPARSSLVAMCAVSPLENEPALGGLEVVVVVELLAADELLELRRRAQPVDAELALDELGVLVGPLARDAVDAQRLDLAADVEGPVVHGVAEAGPDVAKD